MALRIRRSRYGRAAALSTLVTLQTCGGGTEPRDEGSYSANITGAVTATAEGMAGFTTSGGEWGLVMLPRRFGEGWQIFLVTRGPRPAAGTTISIRSPDASEPSTGTHATGDVSRMTTDEFDFWIASAGEIRILASSPSRLSGTFELTAESFIAEGPGQIAVTGTFDALYLPDRPIVPTVVAAEFRTAR
jgi:hypothetical protein